jgi:hypothetical protein
MQYMSNVNFVYMCPDIFVIKKIARIVTSIMPAETRLLMNMLCATITRSSSRAVYHHPDRTLPWDTKAGS